ncbi:MAG TPA: hypothetical protein VF657_09580, partial [Actinoplanes sp.]
MSRAGTLTVVRLGLYLGVSGYLALTVWRTRAVVFDDLREIGWFPVLVAVGFALAGVVPAMLGWRVLLSSLGTHLEPHVAARVYFVAGLGKYLPGALWPAAVQADLARSLGKPPWRFAGAFLASVAVSVVAGAVIGLPILPWLTGAGPAWQVGGIAAAVAAAALSPRLLRLMFAAAGWAVARLPLRSRPSMVLPDQGAVVRSLALTAVGWVVAAGHVLVLAVPLGVGADGAALLLAGYCLATVGGILTVVMPAGLGTREALLVLTVGVVLSGSAILTVVALSRFVVTVADLLAAAAASAYAGYR